MIDEVAPAGATAAAEGVDAAPSMHAEQRAAAVLEVAAATASAHRATDPTGRTAAEDRAEEAEARRAAAATRAAAAAAAMEAAAATAAAAAAADETAAASGAGEAAAAAASEAMMAPAPVDPAVRTAGSAAHGAAHLNYPHCAYSEI